MKIAVLGGGNAAQALAGNLALAGHDVTIAGVPAFAQSVMAIQPAGGLRVEGRTLPKMGLERFRGNLAALRAYLSS